MPSFRASIVYLPSGLVVVQIDQANDASTRDSHLLPVDERHADISAELQIIRAAAPFEPAVG